MPAGKILLVDDVRSILEFEQSVLGKLGLEIITASDGAEAIQLATIEKPFLLVLDLVLPKFNGDVVCKYIKSTEDLKDIGVIIATTMEHPSYLQRCFQCGCDAYMVKPIDPDDLLRKVKVILDEKEVYVDWDAVLEN